MIVSAQNMQELLQKAANFFFDNSFCDREDIKPEFQYYDISRWIQSDDTPVVINGYEHFKGEVFAEKLVQMRTESTTYLLRNRKHPIMGRVIVSRRGVWHRHYIGMEIYELSAFERGGVGSPMHLAKYAPTEIQKMIGYQHNQSRKPYEVAINYCKQGCDLVKNTREGLEQVVRNLNRNGGLPRSR
jgi:hypothetical protein